MPLYHPQYAVETDPTPKNIWILFNNSISFLCSLIIKQGSTVQPIAAVLDLKIDIVKDPSASTNPVTNQGFNVVGLFLLLSINVLKLDVLPKRDNML